VSGWTKCNCSRTSAIIELTLKKIKELKVRPYFAYVNTKINPADILSREQCERKIALLTDIRVRAILDWGEVITRGKEVQVLSLDYSEKLREGPKVKQKKKEKALKSKPKKERVLKSLYSLPIKKKEKKDLKKKSRKKSRGKKEGLKQRRKRRDAKKKKTGPPADRVSPFGVRGRNSRAQNVLP